MAQAPAADAPAAEAPVAEAPAAPARADFWWPVFFLNEPWRFQAGQTTNLLATRRFHRIVAAGFSLRAGSQAKACGYSAFVEPLSSPGTKISITQHKRGDRRKILTFFAKPA